MSEPVTPVEYSKKALPASVAKIGFGLLIFGLLGVVLAFVMDNQRASFNSLIMLLFVASIGVGSVFLVALEYVAGAVWSTPFRRITEFLGALVIFIPIVALPVIFNLHSIFEWTHTEVVAADPVLSGKSGYLNESFFYIRMAFYFVVWILFYFILTGNSRRQDTTGDQKLTRINIRTSAVFIPLFGLTLTFASFDWAMSLEPHWFSTIYGVYYFSGTMLASLAATTICVVYLNEKGYLVKNLNADNYYSLGALLFAFINFWAYIAFSQFLLIWYANLPEETFWFLIRWEGSWKYVTIATIFIHFVIPYAVLAPQPAKKDPKRLKFAAFWILFAHVLDMYWLVMPAMDKTNAVFGWMEIVFPVFAAGLVITVFIWRYKSGNAVAIRDPKLRRGINFRL